jgi:hypothetical protein
MKQYACNIKSQHFPLIPKELEDQLRKGDEAVIKEYESKTLWYNSKAKPVIQESEQQATERQRFNKLSARWKKATWHFSLERQQVSNRTFHEILVMGESAIPFILEDIQKEPIQGWFYALELLSDEDHQTDKLSLDDLIKYWVKWGKEKGYISK